MRHTLRKKNILRGYGAFQEIFSRGEVFTEKRLRILVLRKTPGSISAEVKIGFSVGRRVRSAVLRNLAKRRMRELIRLNKEMVEMECRKGNISAMILLCTPSGRIAEKRQIPAYRDLEQEFSRILPRLAMRSEP